MTDLSQQLAGLRTLCCAANTVTEQGVTAVYMPGVQFEAGGKQVTRDLLLWPAGRDGYSTRLFLSAQVQGSVAQAWSSFSLCGGTWWAVSWQGVPASLSWIEIVGAHLQAFK